MKQNMTRNFFVALGLAISASAAYGQATSKGPSTASTPYVLPTAPGYETISILTVDNTGLTPDDTVPKVGGGTYGMGGVPDGMGAFDNGDGTFTLLVNHEIPSALGVARAHGGVGAYVSTWVINKSTLAVLSGDDLMKTVWSWNAGTQATGSTTLNAVFYRFCSADLAAPTAYYNAATGLGSTARLYLNGEEDTTHGWAMAHVASGTSKGNSYVLGKFNLTTNGSGLTGVGAWETLVGNPYAQDKTVVIGDNDGGTGIMNNTLSVYVGTKQSTGTEVEKAGLMNGTMKFVNVTGSTAEIVSSTTRATNITNGTAFTLSGTSSTTFSRPEDGAWNPANPAQYFFVTTDQLDQVSDGLGAQVGRTRLWRLTFTDITNPDLGGTIDILIDGQTVNSEKVNMFDNIAVNERTGHIILLEDVGGAAHNGKVWDYDLATFTGTTNSGTLKQILKHDPARFGDRVNASTTIAATAPFNNDEETSGIIDITTIMSGGTRHKGITGESWYISSDQAHYTSATGGSTITPTQVEGGQIFMLHDVSLSAANVAITRGGIVRDRLSGKFAQQITLTNNSASTITGPFYLALDGLSTNATLSNATGTTAVQSKPYITVSAGNLAAGASVNVTLLFTNPTSAAISYTTRVLTVSPTP